MRPARLAVLTAAALFASPGCGEDDPGPAESSGEAEVTVLEVVAGPEVDGPEYSFAVPARVEAGPVRVTLSNQGEEDHHAQVFRLDEDATFEDLQQALATGEPAAALEVGTFVGGTGLVSPGDDSQADAVLDLTAGVHVLLCFVRDPGGVPHLAHGMVHPFTVTANDDAPPGPSADDEVEMADYSFIAPDTLDGDAMLAITNRSATEAHEMVVARLEAGVTVDDVVTALREHRPLPATGVGGMQALLPGMTQHLQLDLPAGRYLLLCAVSSSDGTPHYDAGMLQEVTVR